MSNAAAGHIPRAVAGHQRRRRKLKINMDAGEQNIPLNKQVTFLAPLFICSDAVVFFAGCRDKKPTRECERNARKRRRSDARASTGVAATMPRTPPAEGAAEGSSPIGGPSRSAVSRRMSRRMSQYCHVALAGQIVSLI